MADTSFVGQVKNGIGMEPEDNVFLGIWKEYERVIVESLIASFGLDFIVRDQHGGDVDTVHNVRKIGEDPEMKYKNPENQSNYEQRGSYDSVAYHRNEQYIKINARNADLKKNGALRDAYTGKIVKRNENIDLDHVIAAKEIHDDPGRILAGLDGKELANCEENLKPTNRSINRSMRQDEINEYLRDWEEKRPERQARIDELKSYSSLTDKERKELEKLQNLEEIDPNLMQKEYSNARKANETKIMRAYYTGSQFAKDTAIAAGKVGVQMGLRQALGFIFAEIWFCTKEEIQTIPPGSDFKDMLEAVGRGIKKGFESAKIKYKELFIKVEEGVTAGALSSLTTTICNIFFTTAKNLVRCIRQIYAAVVQAGKVLLFNPDNLMFGDRIKTATVIMATGASILVGTTVGEIVGKTPIGMMPIIGSPIRIFCSTFVSGLLSCTLLVFLDRSRLMNTVINGLNRIPSEANNYAEIADLMERLAAKISNIDIDLFIKETEKYKNAADQIAKCQNDKELNEILLATYKELDIKIPWKGDFDTFMGDRSNRLVFS